MKKFMAMILFLTVSTMSYATLTNTTIPVTKNGASNPPTLQNGSITDIGTSSGPGNVGIGSPNPGQALDVMGTVRASNFIIGSQSLCQQNGTNCPSGNVNYWNQSGNNIYPATIANNIGIGSPNPQQILDVEGGNALINNTWNIGIGTPSPTQSLNVNGNASFNGGISSVDWTDPVNDWNVSCSIATTTGTITATTNSLSVASATGWSVGMGIEVANAGTGGNTPLVSIISTIVGTTFTLQDNAITTATTQTVHHNDTVAWQTALNSGKNVYGRQGCQTDVIGPIGIPANVWLKGNNRTDNLTGNTSLATIFWNRSATADVFHVNGSFVHISDVAIIGDAAITPTAGAGIQMGISSGSTFYKASVVENIRMNNVYNGVSVVGHTNAFTVKNVWVSPIHDGFLINNTTPAGGIYWDKDFVSCASATGTIGWYITNSDTDVYDHATATGCGIDIKVDDSNGTTIHQTFIGAQVENGNPNVLVTTAAGSGVSNVSFVGGANDDCTGSDGLDIAGSAKNVSVTGVNFDTCTNAIVVTSAQGNMILGDNNYGPGVTNGIVNTGNASYMGNNLTSTASNWTIKQQNDAVLNGLVIQNGANNTFAQWEDASANSRIDSGSGGTGSILLNAASTGNIGIGTITAPTHALEVYRPVAGSSIVDIHTGGTNPALFLIADGANSRVNIDSRQNWPMDFQTNNTQAMRIDTTQNIGIGTTTPGMKLDVVGTVRALGYTQTGTSADTFTGTTTFSNATNSALFTGGNVGVGSATPGQTLDVQGTIRFSNSLLNTKSATGIGWSEHNATNQACNTTCGTSACVIGLDIGTVGVVNSGFVSCSDATADDCICAGP